MILRVRRLGVIILRDGRLGVKDALGVRRQGVMSSGVMSLGVRRLTRHNTAGQVD